VRVKRKRVLIIGAVCAFVCATALIAWLSEPRQPEYQGKKLSEWLALPMESVSIPTGLTAVIKGPIGYGLNHQTTTAVRAIGTNALPLLVKWVSYEPPDWQRPITLWLSRGRWSGFAGINKALNAKIERANSASLALSTLGRDANDAIPALGAAVAAHKGTVSAERCLGALWSIQKSGADISGLVPELLALEITYTNGPSRVSSYIKPFEDCGPDFIRGLTVALRHRNLMVREEALKHLYVCCAACGRDPNLLRMGLTNSDKGVAEYAARLVSRLNERQAEQASTQK